MTQFFSYGATALGNSTVRLEDGLPGFTQTADGTFAVGGVKIDDPTGALTFTELSQFINTETACSRPRTFTGYLANMKVAREMFPTGAGRRYGFDLLDLNYLLHLQVLRGSTAKRPLETGNQRLTWLLASVGLSGIVHDNGFVASIVDNFDAADYTGQYADNVLADLCVSSISETGRIFFVYWDHSALQASLYIDLPTATTNTSSLIISNVLSEYDGVTTFNPNVDAGLELSGEDIYCAVFFKYKTGQVYRHNDTTHNTYFAGQGFHRQAVFETTRVGSLATAIRHADAYLANHNGTLDTVTCTVRLPPAKVNLLEAGMRVSCKFSHFPAPYNAYGYLRVASRTVSLTQNTDATYDVQLRLTNRSITPGGTGTGSTGDFPHPPGGSPGVVQKSAGGGDRTFLNPIGTGHTLVYMTSTRGALMAPPTSPGYSVGPGGISSAFNNDQVAVYTKLSDGSESLTLDTTGDVSQCGVWFELDGDYSISQHNEGVGPSGSLQTTPNTGSITVGQGDLLLAVACNGTDGGWGANTYTPSAGWTEELDFRITPDHPSVFVGSEVATAAGSYSAQPVCTAAGWWAAQIVSFVSAAAATPPDSGQWVGLNPPEYVTMSGTSGTTAFPFANGSLSVFYDFVDQTAGIVSYDGGAGTFVMAAAPTNGMQVTVRYQGI